MSRRYINVFYQCNVKNIRVLEKALRQVYLELILIQNILGLSLYV